MESVGVIKAVIIHPDGGTDVCINFHGNRPKSKTTKVNLMVALKVSTTVH